MVMQYLYGMNSKNLSRQGLPRRAAGNLESLGRNIRAARTLRGLTMQDLAERAMTSRETIRRLEQGHPGVSVGVLVHVLWVLELDDQIGALAALENDSQGQALALAGLPRRVDAGRTDEFDF